jgi:hypothetical protein
LILRRRKSLRDDGNAAAEDDVAMASDTEDTQLSYPSLAYLRPMATASGTMNYSWFGSRCLFEIGQASSATLHRQSRTALRRVALYCSVV